MHKYIVVYVCDGEYHNYSVEGENKKAALDTWTWLINDGEILNIIRLDEE